MKKQYHPGIQAWRAWDEHAFNIEVFNNISHNKKDGFKEYL